MAAIAGALFLALFVYIPLDLHSRHLEQQCKEGGYKLLTFYDPTGGPPSSKTLMLQFGHPTYEDCPASWWRWTRRPIDWMEFHNERPSIVKWKLPELDPPIRLDDGTFCNNIRCLNQIQESR